MAIYNIHNQRKFIISPLHPVAIYGFDQAADYFANYLDSVVKVNMRFVGSGTVRILAGVLIAAEWPIAPSPQVTIVSETIEKTTTFDVSMEPTSWIEPQVYSGSNITKLVVERPISGLIYAAGAVAVTAVVLIAVRRKGKS